jgi:6-phospho-3-hexuloisomerase
MTAYADLARRGVAEIGGAAAAVDPAGIDALVTALSEARRIVITGAGREGLMMRALAMRLFHLGLDVHVAGDMTTPPVGPGDLLLVSAGPGDLATIRALVGVATAAGARCACITAQPDGPVPRLCDPVLTIPAQTMANDTGPAPASVLPMGSVFEGAQFLVFECLVLILRDRLGTSAETMRANHTNLE